MGYIQGSKMRTRWVLASSSIVQRHFARSGSYELPVWLGDPGIQLVGGSLHCVIGRVMSEGDLVHLGFDPWGITETTIAW